MRISTSWAQQVSVNAMLKQQQSLSKTQLQLSSGLKNLTPSDDPVAAPKILGFKAEINTITQYQRNIDTVRERNNLEESALAAAEKIMYRAKELTIQAANATVSGNDKLAIKAEVDQLLDNLLGISNTRNANNEYIFSGFLTHDKAFAWDANLDAYEFLGSKDQRTLQISEERRIADGESGFSVFENIPSISQKATLTNNTRSVFNTLNALSNALSNNIQNPTATIQSPLPINTPLTLSVGASVTLDSDNPAAPVTINLAGTYNTLDELVQVFNSDPALSAAGIKAQSNGHNLEFSSTTTGVTSSVSITAISTNFDTVTGFNLGDTGNGIDLTTTAPDPLYTTISNEILTDLDNALQSFITARSSVGSRIRTLDNQENQNEKFILDFQTVLSSIEDLDYTEAISRFNQQELVLQAAQQSFTRIQSLSLFNFL